MRASCCLQVVPAVVLAHAASNMVCTSHVFETRDSNYVMSHISAKYCSNESSCALVGTCAWTANKDPVVLD